jgi:hypothetical protein
MIRPDCVSIGLCLLAIVLFDATASRMSFAEEAPAKSDHQPAAESKGGNGEHAAGEGPAKREGNSTNSEGQQSTGHESDRIDTRTSVEPPPGLQARRDDAKSPKALLRSLTHGNVQTHRRLETQPSGPVVRNAIGVTVGPHDNIAHRDGHVPPVIVRGPVGATGVSTSASGGIAKPTGVPEIGRLSPPASTPGAITPHRGTISGTGLVHPGSGPSQIGGPAKSVATINGTTIKPKR